MSLLGYIEEVMTEKNKIKIMLSEKLSMIDIENKIELDADELEDDLESLEPVDKFLKELDAIIKEEYDRYKIPDDSLSRQVSIVPGQLLYQRPFIFAGPDTRNIGMKYGTGDVSDKRRSFEFQISSTYKSAQGEYPWSVIRWEKTFEEENIKNNIFTIVRFKELENLYNYLRELIVNLVAEDILYYKKYLKIRKTLDLPY